MKYGSINNLKFFLVVALIGGVVTISSCRPRLDSDSSGLKANGQASIKCTHPEQVDSIFIAGVGYFGTALAEGSSIIFKKIDRSSKDVCPKTVARTIAFTGGLSGLNLTLPNNAQISMKPAPDKNYGFEQTTSRCEDALQLLGMDATPFAGQNCKVQMDTESNSWYGVSVKPDSVTRDPGFDIAEDNKVKATLQALSKPSLISAPLNILQDVNGSKILFQELNATVDPAVSAALIEFHKKYQMQKTKNHQGTKFKERNTCLRNARAHSWTDLQAHFYCILPLSPERNCFSKELGQRNEKLKSERESGAVNITDIQFAIALRGFMQEALTFCSTPQGGQRAALEFNSHETEVFKHIMFVISGIMDFNITSENEIVNNFYGSLRGIDQLSSVRPARIADPDVWKPEQKRYAEARFTQLQRSKLGLAIKGCVSSNGSWDDQQRVCTCVAPATISPPSLSCQ